MARRAVRGVAVQEGVQTGDGRVIAAGAMTWAELPMPLAWLEHQMHGDLLAGGVQIGTIETVTREADGLAYTGFVDDEIPEGAELVRRLEAGTASNGHRSGISIDPDNWEVELVATDAEEEDGDGVLLLACAGTGPVPAFRGQVQAAAGDPDPNGEGTVLLYADRVDSVLERYTMLRIRGATACAIGAFSTPGCYLELDPGGDEAPADAPVEDETPAPEATVHASAAPALAPVRPPAAWFAIPEPQPGDEGMVEVYGCNAAELLVEQPDGGLGVPLQIASDGRVFGHAARWGQCHVGYPGQCVTAPESLAAYAHFHHGEVVTADGSRVATGTLTVGCDHAAAELLAPDARDHYANSGLAFADVRATNGALGVWVSGTLRPTVTEAQLRLLRASSLSGDWRRIGTNLEFIGALAVNVPGFPIAREAVTAAGVATLPMAGLVATAYVDNGVQLSLTASGVVQRCPECQQRAMAARYGPPANQPDAGMTEALGILRRLELRTRHLVPVQAQAAVRAVRRPGDLANNVVRVQQTLRPPLVRK